MAMASLPLAVAPAGLLGGIGLGPDTVTGGYDIDIYMAVSHSNPQQKPEIVRRMVETW